MRLVAAAASIAFAAGACAAGALTDAKLTKAWAADYEPSDYPTLRGSNPYIPAPPTYNRWSGYYAGGNVGYSVSGMDFANATGDLIAFILRQTTIENENHVSQWPLLGKGIAKGVSFGGFAGYNSQWDDLILGVEANYTHANLTTSSSGSLGRSFTTSDSYDNTVDLTGFARLTVKDFVTLRGRAGYVLGSFLPYAMFGFAVGTAESVRGVTVVSRGHYVGSGGLSDYGPITQTSSETKNVVVYGFSAGLGLDVEIVPNLFARGEWEFVQFKAPDRINAYVNTLRTGLGWRF
jgi:outer membrane immunogenic protein